MLTSIIVAIATAAPLAILEQPRSQAVQEGNAITLRIVASGPSALQYQWHFAAAGNVSFALLNDETNSTYTIASVGPQDTGSYLCTVQSGEQQIYSEAALVSLLTNLPNLSLTIVNPTNGATFRTPVNVPAALSISATLIGQPLRSRWVDFSTNGSLVGTVGGTTNFTVNWSNVVVGDYTLQAASVELVEDAWITFVSEPISITVAYGGVALIGPGAAWMYHDEGTALPADWAEIDFVDATWPTGQGQFGYGDGDEQTHLRFSSGPDTNFITSYFRTMFFVEDAGAYSNLQARLLRDDGAVVYLNGVELFRDNMPEGPIDRFTPAGRGLGFPEESTFYPRWLNPARLRRGTNVLAVELHQIIPFAGDASFDMALIGNIPVLPPELRIRLHTTNTILSWSANFPGYKLQSTTPLAATPSATIWTDLAVPVTDRAGEFSATIEALDGHHFFRLAVE